MLTSSIALNQALDNGLVLKSVRNMEDVERLAAFNASIFNPSEAQMTRSLILKHPRTRSEHWLYVEDEATGQIISSLGLIPWEWRYQDVVLKSGEMGLVGTHEAYRNRGLIRHLVTQFKVLLREGDYDLSNIQGIPYFYRQFDYEYAIPLEANWHVELHHLPDAASDNAASFQFRRASLDDIPVLMAMYEAANATLDICAVRNADTWRYLLEDAVGGGTETEFWLVLDAAGTAVGYWQIVLHGFGSALIVGEASRLSEAAAEALLLKLKSMARERDKPNIRLNLPTSSDFVRLAQHRGAHNGGAYAWQIHVVDTARFLRRLAPVLERRVANSLFAGLNEHVIINTYREAFDLHFERGKLLAVNAMGFCHEGAIRIPPFLIAPLVLGHRSLEELAYMYPDVGCWGRGQHLINVLFPKLDSYLFANY